MMQVLDALEQQGCAALQMKDPELRRNSLQTTVLVGHPKSTTLAGPPPMHTT